MSDTFQIQGKTFTIKPYSRGNSNRYANKVQQMEKANLHNVDYFEYAKQVLLLIADGPHDEIDATADDFDARTVEEMAELFMPMSKRLSLLLSGF